MTRSVPEWVATHPDQDVPPRVRFRIWLRDGGVCQCGCTTKIVCKDWDLDHKVALVNGGEHRETNLQVMLRAHHRDKTKADVAEKSRVRRKAMRHAGIRKRKHLIPGSVGTPWRKRLDGTVEPR